MKQVGETKCSTTRFLMEANDDSFALSDPVLEGSPPFLRKGSLLPVEGSKHHTEAATKDGLGDRYGGQEIM